MEIVFLISLLLVSAVILSKYIETRTGTKTLLQRLLTRFDLQAFNIISQVKYRIFQAIQIVRFMLFVRLPEKGKVSYQEARDSAMREYQKKKEVLMGRKTIKTNGAVSFFLRKIKEDSLNGNKGKIEG